MGSVLGIGFGCGARAPILIWVHGDGVISGDVMIDGVALGCGRSFF
jgi:hypothetical protein